MALLIVLVVLCAALIFYLIFIFADSSFIVMQDSEGMITNKKFIPAHTILLWTGKVAIPQYHHDAWKIEVKIENKTVKKRILKILYDSLNIGDKVMVRYGTGRFRGKFYVKSISAIK